MQRIATADRMVEAIAEAENPFATKNDIADLLDVTWKTIDNNEDELQNDPRVKSCKLGNARVYYLASLEEEPVPADAGEHRGADEESARTASDYHLFERAAFYSGFISLNFALLLAVVFLLRGSIAAIAQWSISPVIPLAYYGGLLVSIGLLTYSMLMLRLINSGVLRGWTSDLDREDVEAKIQAAKRKGISWTWISGAAYLAVAIATGVARTQVSGVLSDLLLAAAVLPLLALLGSAAFTAVCYLLLATSRAYYAYSLVKQYLPDPVREEASSETTGSHALDA